jgi:site-specific recombinase XerD
MQASLSLIKITNQYFLDSTHLFVSLYIGLRLTVYKTKSYIHEVMRLAGIPDNYGVYSIKHATISYLLKRGISEETINKIARYSPGSAMVSNQNMRWLRIKEMYIK